MTRRGSSCLRVQQLRGSRAVGVAAVTEEASVPYLLSLWWSGWSVEWWDGGTAATWPTHTVCTRGQLSLWTSAMPWWKVTRLGNTEEDSLR